MRYVEPSVSPFLEHVLARVRALPGVAHVALAGNVPMGPGETQSSEVRVSGKPARWADFTPTTSEFLEALGIPLKRGRYFNEQDRTSTVVNEAFIREFFPGGDALGQVITLGSGPEERPRQVVGVADYRQYHPRMPIQAEVYTSYFQQPARDPRQLPRRTLSPTTDREIERRRWDRGSRQDRFGFR